MQGLRLLCPACADESQKPVLIHTPEHQPLNPPANPSTHAQTPGKIAYEAKNAKPLASSKVEPEKMSLFNALYSL